MIVRKQVNPDGTVPGLETMAGEEVVIIRARTEKVAKALERPMAVVEDVLRYVREHRELMTKQVGDFTARYGNPAEKAREYAKHLNADDVKSKVRELNELVEKRLETISKDLEKRYEDLEREVETAIENIFAGSRKEGETTPVTPEPAPTAVEAEAGAEAEAAAEPKPKRGRAANGQK